MSIDFQRIHDCALGQFQQLMDQWLPGGEPQGHDYCPLNPTRDDRSVGSFRIAIQTGQWIDFATGDKGGDLVSLWAYLQGGLPMGQAAREVCEHIGLAWDEVTDHPRPSQIAQGLSSHQHEPAQPQENDHASDQVCHESQTAGPSIVGATTHQQAVESTAASPDEPTATSDAVGAVAGDTKATITTGAPVTPVPDDAPALMVPDQACTVPIWNSRKGQAGRKIPQALWTYRNAKHQLLGYVMRLNKSDGSKITLPVTWCPRSDGNAGWTIKGFDAPRPLFGLDRLAGVPDAPVLVVEGEKAAVAAQLRWRDGAIVVVTSPGGSKAVRKADWSPLAGRSVTIWPDNDAAGLSYAADVRQALQAVGAASIAQVDLAGLQELLQVEELASGFDAADVPDDVATEVLEAWLKTATKVAPTPIATGAGEAETEAEAAEPPPPDPGPVPTDLLQVPGFVGQVMEFCLETAPYPNPVLAFCGAMALQSVLAGRCVRDESDNRANLYLLGLANSGAGKDHPRKVNQRIMLEAGMAEQMGDSFASGEGIEDRMLLTPTMLFQTDEMDALLIAIREGMDGRSERIMQALLKFYSSANGIYPMRVKAGAEPMFIDQPCLSLFGTAIPQHFYESLSSKMLSNGFFARMLILESGKRGQGQRARTPPIPETILDTVRWWREYKSRRQGSTFRQPQPATVSTTDDANELMADIRRHAESAYTEHEAQGNQMGMAIWARAAEKVHRLALGYACSERHQSPVIAANGVQWAWKLTQHQTKRMIAMATSHVYDGEFDQRQKKVIHAIGAQGGSLSQKQVTRVLRNLPVRERDEVIGNLLATNQVVLATETTKGRPRTVYRLPRTGRVPKVRKISKV